MTGTSRILLVEDDPGLGNELQRALKRDGWPVDHVATLAEAYEAVIGRRYRAVLLDRRLPDGDGLSLIAAVASRQPGVPVIVLTARDEVADRIEGLDAGAADYLIKPFAYSELLARLRVVCRRSVSGSPVPDIELGRLRFDSSSREITIDGRSVIFPRRELALLEILVRRAGRVVQRSFIESQLYGMDDDVLPNALDTQVSRLRRRLDELSAGVELRTVRGVGYLLQAC